MFDLDGRVAIVTGDVSGIGLGICEVLTEAGARVIIGDRDEAGAHAQVSSGAAADAVIADLTDASLIVAAVVKVAERHGTPWTVVNNAGLQHREPLLKGSLRTGSACTR